MRDEWRNEGAPIILIEIIEHNVVENTWSMKMKHFHNNVSPAVSIDVPI